MTRAMASDDTLEGSETSGRTLDGAMASKTRQLPMPLCVWHVCINTTYRVAIRVLDLRHVMLHRDVSLSIYLQYGIAGTPQLPYLNMFETLILVPRVLTVSATRCETSTSSTWRLQFVPDPNLPGEHR
jgi:hypothetical protein